jgi:hypothetical protein
MKITFTPLLRLLGIVMLLGLAACAQTTEDTVSTETADTFVSIFPANFFEAGYTENYVITGSDQEGRIYTGTFELATSNVTMFNGEPAVPIGSTLTYSRPINGVAVSPKISVLTEYFSVSIPRKYLGSDKNDTAVIMTPVALPVEIPEVVNAEGSGKVGEFVGTDVSAESISWAINKLGDDLFQISYFSEVTNSAGEIINSEAQTFNIDATGERHAWALDAVMPGDGVSFSFSGTRI